jgi:heme exporter protein A
MPSPLPAPTLGPELTVLQPLSPLPPRTLALDALAGGRGEKRLFEGVSLSLGPGAAVQLRGPNGSGKTTLLLVVAGVLSPAAGRVRLLGGDPEGRSSVEIGYLGHRAGIKARLTVTENLQFWAALNGGAPAGIAAALELVGLAPIATLDAGLLSAGQTRRLALARLILAERPVWLLDEPTAALDAAGEALVARLIDTQLDRGGVVLAATHHDLGLRHELATIELGQPVSRA